MTWASSPLKGTKGHATLGILLCRQGHWPWVLLSQGQRKVRKRKEEWEEPLNWEGSLPSAFWWRPAHSVLSRRTHIRGALWALMCKQLGMGLGQRPHETSWCLKDQVVLFTNPATPGVRHWATAPPSGRTGTTTSQGVRGSKRLARRGKPGNNHNGALEEKGL